MSEVKHTPGPWRSTEGIFEYDGRLHRVIAQDASVAEGIHVPVAAALQNGEGEEQRDANARLIAAAPDLLAVVKDTEAVIDTVIDTLRDRLRAAITKAEGSPSSPK